MSDFSPVQTESIVSAESAEAQASAPATPQTVEIAEGDRVNVPDLTGKSVRQATEMCVEMGLNPVLAGSGTVQVQQPEAGAVVRRGASVVLRFGRGELMARAQARAGR